MASPVRLALRVLAVDGGGSAIRLRHSEQAASHVLEGVSRGAGTHAAVARAVEQGWRRAGEPPVDRAVLGLTTAPARRPDALALGARVGEAIRAAEVWVCDDSVSSHAGALSLGTGVSLVVGTGVACLAVPEHGEPRIVGGHGYLLGDEGGAFWIGREGIRAVLRAAEGRAEPSALTAAAAARFGDLGDLHVRLHDDEHRVDAIAQFAPDVIVAAAGDDVAYRIVRDAADELSDLVRAAAWTAAARPVGAPVPVGIGGRLLAEDTLLRRELDARLAAEPGLAPRDADASPLEGAMLLGRQRDPGRYAPLVTTWNRAA